MVHQFAHIRVRYKFYGLIKKRSISLYTLFLTPFGREPLILSRSESTITLFTNSPIIINWEVHVFRKEKETRTSYNNLNLSTIFGPDLAQIVSHTFKIRPNQEVWAGPGRADRAL